MKKSPEYLTTAEAIAAYGVSKWTLAARTRDGLLHPIQNPTNLKQKLYRASELKEAFTL